MHIPLLSHTQIPYAVEHGNMLIDGGHKIKTDIVKDSWDTLLKENCLAFE